VRLVSRPVLSLVVAHTRNRVIGRGGGMPWHLPADLKHFKAITMDKPIVMGRRTHASIGKALPGRRNIVVTRDRSFSADGVLVAHSLDEALVLAGDADEVMVIGGGQLYSEALPYARRIHLTEIDTNLDGDTWFPELDPAVWKETAREPRDADTRNAFAMSFVTLERT
jgi:dihydrofolate reductase